MKIVTVVGARPQFIKAAAVSRVLRAEMEEILVHTGQHYDANMSEVFFTELDIPYPDMQLHIGSGGHGAQTGQMLQAIEQVLLDVHPDAVLVYGDTNSTLAGALAAAKLHLPVAHVEAGLRSFNRRMPEEINRVMTDHLATLLFAPTAPAVENLHREGIAATTIHLVGDVMYDAARYYRARAEDRSDVLARERLDSRAYLLATVHRAENTDDPARLRAIWQGLCQLAERMPVALPLHPRTRGVVTALGLTPSPHLRLLEPVGYLDMVMLEQHAAAIITDSGGVQKEAFFARVPCITLREETEWVETIDAGANRLVGADTARLLAAVDTALGQTHTLPDPGPYYGDGKATARIAALLGRLHDGYPA